MPIFGGKQIAELQQKLAIGEQQYNDAQRTIAELSGLIERAGGGEITRMRALVEQTRREQEAAIASLRQQHEQHAKQLAQGQAAAEKRLRDINMEVERSAAKLERVKAKTMEQKAELHALGIRYDEGIKMLDVGWTDYESPAASSVALKGQLDEVRATIKEMIRTGAAVDASETFTFNDSKAKGRKFVHDMAKMMLRAYNA